MSPSLPLLRSPPFPGTAPETAVVSRQRPLAPVREDITPQLRERAQLIRERIVEARIGGRFWAAGADNVWDQIARGERLAFAGDDERGLLALIAGASVDWTGPGPFADIAHSPDPDALDRAVTRWLIDGADYRDPFSGRPVAIEAAIDQLAFWRQAIDRNRGLVVAAGIARWKRREVEAMLWPGDSLVFAGNAADAVGAALRGGGEIAVWPSKAPRGLAEEAAAHGVNVHPVEDGFLRSAGLGSDCHPPHSIILDRSGLHLDPTRPSDLEAMIAAPADPALLARAERLMRSLVDAGISKYASGGAPWERPVKDRRIVLVTGQVEDDLSVKLGGAGVEGNLDLIRRARAAEPDAWLVFKPHPDVDAGHRRGAITDAVALRHVDQVVRDVPMASMLDAVDAVHVLTSLTGFEALIRGCDVVTHGQPFYAGWGLTRDLAPPIERRRGHNVTKAQLVAATLILYPRYLDPVTKLPCSPEILVERLAAEPEPRETLLTRLRRLQGRLRRTLSVAGGRA